MRTREALAALGRTALLCGALGLALYLALSAFAGNVPHAHLWLSLAIGGAGAALFGFECVAALRTGIVHAGRLVAYRRRDQPVRFWSCTGFLAACTAAMVAILGLSARGLLA